MFYVYFSLVHGAEFHVRDVPLVVRNSVLPKVQSCKPIFVTHSRTVPEKECFDFAISSLYCERTNLIFFIGLDQDENRGLMSKFVCCFS